MLRILSTQAAEICAHMSDREIARVRWLQRRNAAIIGGIVGAGACVPPSFLRHRFGVGESFAAYVSLYVLAALVIGALLLPWASRSLRACLASTEYAKARGISAKDFPLYNFTGSGK